MECEYYKDISNFQVSIHLRNEFIFWNVVSVSLKGFTLTLQETRSIHDSMNIPKSGFIAYIYIYYKCIIYRNNL